MTMFLPRQSLELDYTEQTGLEIVHVGLTGTIGAALIAHIISLFLNAFTWIQTVIYFQKNYADWILFKGVVVVICLLGIAHEALVTQGLYVYLVTFRGNSADVLRPQWAFGAQVYVTELNNVIIRSVYAYRIWRLSIGRLQRAVSLVIVVLSCYVFGSSCIFGTIGVRTIAWLDNQNATWTVYSSYGVEIVTDCLIATSMCFLLVRLRTGLTGSDSIVQKFMAYSIYTGVLTTICVAMTLATYIADPSSFVYLSFYFIFSKLYTISLLGSLNARTLLIGDSQRTTQILTTAVILEGGSQPSLLSAAEEVEVGRSRMSIEVGEDVEAWNREQSCLALESVSVQASSRRENDTESVTARHATHPQVHMSSITEGGKSSFIST
ncbi:hypothetical protein BKA93DRAFT_755076 [Sparassis latifolia]|uniref:DUF6534 domain-containing protein n=1 Tax=Sparassis crispa TaxID=139825 RepID=A0A401GV67_9APHY|nr:hypothetical protein SCP_0801530 [Sparassis crispa]GBE85634.1 hypothetical protein SCP_0801530 [Sparassis crispa]